jgi:hypothetical protein
MNGERVAQQVRRYRLADTGEPTRLLAGLLDCTSVDGLANDIPLEEPSTWPRRSPIRPQGLQQLRRKHYVTVFFPGAVVLFASSLRPDMARLRLLLEGAGSRAIVIAENNESAGSYIHQGFRGVVFRNVSGTALVECVRRVAAGDTWAPPQLAVAETPEEDMVGTRVRDRLTPKEMRIVALIVQGCKNREKSLCA